MGIVGNRDYPKKFNLCFMNGLSGDLVNRVLARLDINALISTDAESLQRLYSAWCRHIPFDNIRKMIVLSSGDKQPLPGIDATDFFEHWLQHGCGGTCWPVANAFYELVFALGFNVQRIAGSMRDMGVLNHGSVKVVFDNKEFLAEASLLLNRILPLGNDTIIHHDPVCPMELEKDTDTWLLWMKTPPNEQYYACRLHTNPID
jgi:arylamine N-acetyltransferase